MTTYYLLGLVKESDYARSPEAKQYGAIAEQVRTAIKDLYQLRPDHDYKPDDDKEVNRFCEYHCKLDGTSLVIQHYKMRLIFKWERESPGSRLPAAFEAAGAEFGRTKAGDPFRHKELTRNLTEASPSFVDGVFFYPLAEIDHDYRSADFAGLGSVPLTTFFYELPDYRRMKGFGGALNLAFRFRIPRTVIRVSRPCTITTRMSDYLRAELINILYDTCLYSKRRLNKKCTSPGVPFRDSDMSEKTFDKVKNSIGRSLYDAEASSSNTESASSLYRLSLIMSLGAVASILALIVFASIGEWKSWIGAIIGVWAVFVLALGLWRR